MKAKVIYGILLFTICYHWLILLPFHPGSDTTPTDDAVTFVLNADNEANEAICSTAQSPTESTSDFVEFSIANNDTASLSLSEVKSSSSTPAVPAPKQRAKWLAARLLECGVDEELARDCEQKLAVKQGFVAEFDFAELLPSEVDAAYLNGIGIAAIGVQKQIIKLHKALREKYSLPLPAPPPVPAESTNLQSGKKRNKHINTSFAHSEVLTIIIFQQLCRHFPVVPCRLYIQRRW